MKKVSLVSAAVMAAISMSATAADWNTSDDGVYKVTNNGAVSHDTVTVTGEESSSATAHALLVLASGDVSFKNVTLQGYQISEGNTKTVGSYFKTWAKNLSIENLTLDSDPNGGYSINTLEFRALAGTSQALISQPQRLRMELSSAYKQDLIKMLILTTQRFTSQI